MSVVDCTAYEELELGLLWTVEYTENLYLVCGRPWSTRRTCTGSIIDCRVYGGQVLGLYWTVEYTED